MAAGAQGPPQQARAAFLAPKSAIAVSVPGLACSTSVGAGAFAAQAWSWGAENESTSSGGSGAGSGRASISALQVKKQFDACTPALFGAVVTGKHFPTLMLTQQNASGDTVATVALQDVLVTGWNVGSTTAQALATETVSFDARKVCITDVPSGSRFCYDLAAGTTF
jgi:type VI protein secretion system component Hcp